MSDSLSVKGARNSSSAFYGKCAQKRCKYMQQYIEVSIMLFKSNFHMSRPRVCVCGCVRSRSGCVFWFVSCIEPVGGYLKLIICNVSILQRGFPRHEDFIYIDLCSHWSLLSFCCFSLMCCDFCTHHHQPHWALLDFTRPTSPYQAKKPRPVINAMFL